jgi:UV DNA damage repair endonuclease
MTDQILGLTCISEQLKDKDKKEYSFRTMTRKRFNDLCVKEGRNEAIKELSNRILSNVIVTSHIVHHCAKSNIGHYRVSSSLCPLVSDETLEISLQDLPNIEEIKQELRQVGIVGKTLGISMGSHPDQFNVLASLNQDAVRRTIGELNMQASVLDMMGLPQDHTAPMNIHINYSPKDNETLEDVAERFYSNLMKCDSGVYNRLTIENEDKCFFNVDNCIKFSEYLFDKYNHNIPVCADNLHHQCNPSEVVRLCTGKQNVVHIHGLIKEKVKIILSLLSFIGQKASPKNLALMQIIFLFGNFPPYIAIEPDKPAIYEIETKRKDYAIKLLQEQMAGAI